MKHAAVLGAGAWGTAVALVLAQNGHTVRLWTRNERLSEDVNRARANDRYLPGVVLDPAISCSPDLHASVRDADLVVVAVPSHAFRHVLTDALSALPQDATVVSATKGIENGTLMLMGEIVGELLGQAALQRFAVLSGPSFALEVARGLPTALVCASFSRETALRTQRRCATERLRVYTSDDPIGVEMGGALKNVVAIAAGACDGLGYGHNSRAALITRGLAEIGRVATAKGGAIQTLAGLAGLGDLVLTCTGELSRNRTVGFEMGRGLSLEQVLEGLGHVAEGVKTTKSAHELALRLQVDMPITQEVYRVLYEHKPVKQAVVDLMSRELRPEFS